jgi:glutamate-5-semialdehyde dehydrogenase
MSSAEEIAKAAKSAFEDSQLIPSAERVTALQNIREALASKKAEILAANKEDLKVTPAFPPGDVVFTGCAGRTG